MLQTAKGHASILLALLGEHRNVFSNAHILRLFLETSVSSDIIKNAQLLPT